MGTKLNLNTLLKISKSIYSSTNNKSQVHGESKTELHLRQLGLHVLDVDIHCSSSDSVSGIKHHELRSRGEKQEPT